MIWQNIFKNTQIMTFFLKMLFKLKNVFLNLQKIQKLNHKINLNVLLKSLPFDNSSFS